MRNPCNQILFFMAVMVALAACESARAANPTAPSATTPPVSDAAVTRITTHAADKGDFEERLVTADADFHAGDVLRVHRTGPNWYGSKTEGQWEWDYYVTLESCPHQ